MNLKLFLTQLYHWDKWNEIQNKHKTKKLYIIKNKY